MLATRTRWRIGVLDSNPRSRAEVSRLIESGGATVVVDAPPRSGSVALLRRLARDAVVLAAENAMRYGDPVGGVLPPDPGGPGVGAGHRRRARVGADRGRDGGAAPAAPPGRAAP